MNEIHDITKSMGLTLKPVKCKSISIRSGRSDDCTFAIGDVVLKSLKDAPEKFLGSNITLTKVNLRIFMRLLKTNLKV